MTARTPRTCSARGNRGGRRCGELGYDVVATPRGVLVTAVTPDVPAAKVLEPDDVIVAVGSVPVRTPTQPGGDRAPEAGRRIPADRPSEGKPVEVTVRTIASPEDPSRAIVGILVDQDAKIELPFEVDIDLGRVGGRRPASFALEIARQLGRDVTKGCRIAATGALALDGPVIPIGGVNRRRSGARAGCGLLPRPGGRERRGRAGECRRPRDHPC